MFSIAPDRLVVHWKT